MSIDRSIVIKNKNFSVFGKERLNILTFYEESRFIQLVYMPLVEHSERKILIIVDHFYS